MMRVEPVAVDAAIAATITGLVNRAFSVEEWFVEGDRITPGAVMGLATNGVGQFSMAFADDDTPVGCIYTEIREDRRGYFGLLAVEAAQQGAGIGGQLVRHAEESLRARGCDTVEITVVDLRTELFPYYRKRGYREDGRTLPFPRRAKRPCHLVYLSRPLVERGPHD